MLVVQVFTAQAAIKFIVPARNYSDSSKRKKPQTLGVCGFKHILAEAVRFELTEVVKPRQFSRLLHSTALPSFLLVVACILT